MRKLLFFDVDGTIADRVGKKNVVPQSAKDAIKNLQKNGHLCFINTGRALSEIDVYLKELNMVLYADAVLIFYIKLRYSFLKQYHLILATNSSKTLKNMILNGF